MKALAINIIGLGNKVHQFDFKFGDDFFVGRETDFECGSAFTATLLLDKHETFIEVDFKISGHVVLVCDRSLETFDQPVRIGKKIVFKYGEEAAELSDDIIVIPRDLAALDLGQYVYEFIMLSLPMKRLHPKFGAEDEEETEGKVIYSSATDDTPDGGTVDPRWEKLKKLK